MKSAFVRIAYYNGVKNVGDIANVDLISCMSGLSSYQARDTTLPHLLAIGSTIASAVPTSVVWGSGVMHPSMGVGTLSGDNVCALRGKETWAALESGGIQFADCPLGDPGYLLPKLMSIERKSGQNDLIGLAPHYTDRNHPFFTAARENARSFDLDVRTSDVRSFMENMSRCELVISSSLHGLILAEAMGVPNVWVVANNAIGGGRFKFDDWFSTCARPGRSITVDHECDVEEIAKHAVLHDCLIEVDALKGAFPLSRIEDLSVQDAEVGHQTILPADLCRRNDPIILIPADSGMTHEDIATTIDSSSRCQAGGSIVLFGLSADDALAALAIEGDLAGKVRALGWAFSDFNIRLFFTNWAEPASYVVAEAGVCLDQGPKIEAMTEVLGESPMAKSITHTDNAGRRKILCRSILYSFLDNQVMWL